MILALDNGLRDLGWAVVDDRLAHLGRVHALGTLHQEPDADEPESVDRAMRSWSQALRLITIARAYGCTRVVGEAMSFGGPPKARFSMAVSLGLSWGVVSALSVALELDLAALPPKVWQREIVPDLVGAIDYESVERRLSLYVNGAAAADLIRIPKARRNHAIDAVGIGVVAAVKPELLLPIAGVADLHADDEIKTFHTERAKGLT